MARTIHVYTCVVNIRNSRQPGNISPIARETLMPGLGNRLRAMASRRITIGLLLVILPRQLFTHGSDLRACGRWPRVRWRCGTARARPSPQSRKNPHALTCPSSSIQITPRVPGRGISSPVINNRPLVIGPVHTIGVSSEHNQAQRMVLLRTRRLRHHRLTPVFMPGFVHYQVAKRFPWLRPPVIQGSDEIVMRRPRAAIFQLTKTPELRHTLLPASHGSL